MAFHEVRERCKGIEEFGRQLGGESANRIGKRNTTRIMSDAYGKGIVRGQVECANLRAYARDDDVTAAESNRTCGTTAFYAREFVEMVERLADCRAEGRRAQFTEVDIWSSRRRKVTIRDVAMLCGLRPQLDGLWHLSPCEFTTLWTPVLASCPAREQDSHETDIAHS